MIIISTRKTNIKRCQLHTIRMYELTLKLPNASLAKRQATGSILIVNQKTEETDLLREFLNAENERFLYNVFILGL